MVIYCYIEIIGEFLLPPNFLYNVYDHENYCPGKPVNIYTIINKYDTGEQ